MKKTGIFYICLSSLMLLAIGCKEDVDVNTDFPEEEGQGSEYVGNLMATGVARAAGPSTFDIGKDIISVSDFEEGSIIYISQLGTVADPDYTIGATENQYKYVWFENENAQWDNDQYNFKAQNAPIYWEDVRKYGQVGNSFSMYGMYFPVNQTIRFNVETDQTNEEALLVSDILGAYHATSALYSRLRFRFFHLMVYLKVTIYVPVYEISGDESTGYEADALLKAFVVNPVTNFNINWRANRSSDTEAPLVDQPTSPTRNNIVMYQHPVSDEVTTIDVSNYYSKGELTTDDVRTYEFSVLFPPQTFTGNILSFQLQTPGQQSGGGEDNYITYNFAASQLTTESNDFRFTQGTLQYLNLYLPRHANETVLVGANIIDWNQASTGMTVVEQTKEAD